MFKLKPIILLLLSVSCLPAATVYNNLANDTGVSLIFTDASPALTEAGDLIQFSQASSVLGFAIIGTYSSNSTVVTSSATLRIYDVNLSGTDPTLGSLLGTYTLLGQSFTGGTTIDLLSFQLNGLAVGQNAIWTLSFSNPTGLGLNNFGAATIGSSATESYFAGTGNQAPTYRLLSGASDLNFQAAFEEAQTVPEPSTLLLSGFALAALVFHRRRALAVLPFFFR